MTIDVLNIEGQKTGRTIELPQDIFGAEPSNHAMYLAVKQYLAAQRQGTAKVKTRSEVKGASRKLHRQKGTGGSRKGNIRNPLYKGGGTIFGPEPRGYDIKVNRRVKDLARVSALAYKAQENAILVVEDINWDTPKTKTAVEMLTKLGIENKKALFVYPESNDNLYLSLRNVPNADGNLLSDVHTYEIMNAETLVLTESAAKIFEAAGAEVDPVEA